MNIQLVPRVCKELVDQSLCQQAVNACGANTDPDICTVKLLAKGIANPEPMVGIKAMYGFGNYIYKFGHDYMHHFARDLVQNISGEPGKVGAVGEYIANVLGVQ